MALVGFALYAGQNSQTENKNADEQRATFESEELGFTFDYLTGPDGYVLEETIFSGDDISGLETTITLLRTEDKLNLDKIPMESEGPPTIIIQTFNNPNNYSPREWAEKNTGYSNIHLRFGEITEAVADETQTIRYMADGLYASDNTVISNRGMIYLATGQFIDQISPIRKDFLNIVDSMRFN